MTVADAVKQAYLDGYKSDHEQGYEGCLLDAWTQGLVDASLGVAAEPDQFGDELPCAKCKKSIEALLEDTGL